MVQFQHRMLAYVLVLLALAHLLDAAGTAPRSTFHAGARWVALAVVGQAGIGMYTLIHAAPISLSLIHQGMAIVAADRCGLACAAAEPRANIIRPPPGPLPGRR